MCQKMGEQTRPLARGGLDTGDPGLDTYRAISGIYPRPSGEMLSNGLSPFFFVLGHRRLLSRGSLACGFPAGQQ